MSLAQDLEGDLGQILINQDDIHSHATKALAEHLNPLCSKYSIFDTLTVEGLDAEQIWEQARMVIDNGIGKLFSQELANVSDQENGEESGAEFSEDESLDDSELQDEGEIDEDQSMDEPSSSEENEEDGTEKQVAKYSDLEDEEAEEELSDGQPVDLEGVVQDFDEQDEELDSDEPESLKESEKKFAKDVHGLNDGFFDIDQFNKQSENMDSRTFGEEEDDESEEIDYFADPDEQDVEVNEGDNANEIRYSDFFGGPKPTSARGRRKEISDRPKKRARFADEEEEDNDFQGLGTDLEGQDYADVVDSVRKDLFADDAESDKDEDDGTHKSSHEQLRQAIERQAREYELQNVKEKNWTVKGEAKGRDRPLNALLEEDLDYERGAKPVPVITEEVTSNLEDMIRGRVDHQNFDDIPRRLPPDSITDFKKSRLVDVQETKSSKSLADLYEEDHLKTQDPNGYIDPKNVKLQKAHKDIKELFDNISYKLDALSSWHFTPKPPKPSLSIVSDTAAISMEEAQPSGMATANMLAPQEVYRPGQSKKESNGEIIGPNGLPMARSEMTREEKSRLRRRLKNRRAKEAYAKEELQRAKAASSSHSGTGRASRAEVIQTLKKARNVTVLDNKGQKRDMSGNIIKDKHPTKSTNLKL